MASRSYGTDQAFASSSATLFKISRHDVSTHGIPSKFRRAEVVVLPSRRVRNGSSAVRAAADGSSSKPDPSQIPPPSSSSSANFSYDALLEDLRDEGSKRQAVAFVNFARLQPQLALKLLEESGVLQSKYRKTRIAALNALGALKIVNQSVYLADLLENDPDYSIRAAAAGALSYILDGGDSPLSSLQASKNSSLNGNGSTRAKVNGAAGEIKDEECLRVAARALRHAATEDEHFIVRYSSIVALGTLRDVASVDMLLPLIQTFGTPTLEAAAAIDALGEILRPKDVSEKVLSVVRARATDTDDLVRAAVARTFDAWRAIPEAAENLTAMLRNEVKFGRSSIVLSLIQTLIAREGNP